MHELLRYAARRRLFQLVVIASRRLGGFWIGVGREKCCLILSCRGIPCNCVIGYIKMRSPVALGCMDIYHVWNTKDMHKHVRWKFEMEYWLPAASRWMGLDPVIVVFILVYEHHCSLIRRMVVYITTMRSTLYLGRESRWICILLCMQWCEGSVWWTMDIHFPKIDLTQMISLGVWVLTISALCSIINTHTSSPPTVLSCVHCIHSRRRQQPWQRRRRRAHR